MRKIVFASSLMLFVLLTVSAQSYQFSNGNWWINGRFVKQTMYTTNGVFSLRKPVSIDSVVNLQNQYCIPPFGDAHTHNLDGAYNLQEKIHDYLQEGVFYVQVLGNYGSGATQARPILKNENRLEATYANGLLTATYGHGFYPYEPLAMGVYTPADQMRLADSIKRSRKAENNAYFFLDSIADVDAKWPLILKYKPDHLKICLLDAANYAAKRKAEIPGSYGLSPLVAAYVVKKAHAVGLRVFAHIETADDARICAKIGVDALAHLPGYAWNGREETRTKYCSTPGDVAVFKKAGLAVIPTINLDYTKEFTGGGVVNRPDEQDKVFAYKRSIVNALLRAKVPLALGGDYYGKTVEPEIDTLIARRFFTPAQLIDVWCRQTPQLIFPKRKLGEIKKGYEASFLVLKQNPLTDIQAIKAIEHRVKQGKFLKM